MATEGQVVEAIRHIQQYHPDWRGHLNDEDYGRLKEILRASEVDPGHWPNRIEHYVPDTLIGALRNQWPALFNGPALVDPPPAAPPPPPPAPPADISGEAADAAKRLDAALAKNRNALNAADDQLADAILHAKTKSEEGRATLQALQQSIIDKVTKLGSTLDTPAGQRELAEFLQGANAQILNVVKNAGLDSQSQAEILDGLGARYTALAATGGHPEGEPAGKQASDTPPPSTPPGTDPSGVTASGPAAGAPGGDPLTGGVGPDPLMSGLGALAPAMGALGGIPASLGSMMPFGGGGGGLPLGDLGSGIGGALRDAGDHDRDHGHDAADPLKDPAPGTKPSGDGSTAKGDSSHQEDPTTQPAAGAGVGGTTALAGAGQNPPGAQPDTSVKLPDGRTRVASSVALAKAGRQVLEGASIDDAFPAANIQLPPLGSPVTAAISPSRLQFGDIGEYSDHRVMALGDNEVWVNGQVSALDQLQTGPNFLGWQRLSAPASPAPVAALAGANGAPH